MPNHITLFFLVLLITGQSQTTPNTIKPYDEVITSKVITKKGFLQVHLLDNKLYFEIPAALLNKDILFVKYTLRSDYKQIKWVKEGHSIQMIIPTIKSEVGNIFVDRSSYKANIMVANFPILSEGSANSTYVIDVTDLFLNPPKGLPGNGAMIFDGLAHIDKVLAVDNSIEVQIKKTITSKEGPRPVIVNFNMVLLPEPMMPRLWDHRMGFGKENSINGDNDIVRAAISRWRLEKNNPDQLLSDPIKPITLYFDPTTPTKWKPYIKAGIEQWLPAFEAAGFKNAIVIKESPIHDKNWSLHSTRYSIIRWSDNSNYRGKEGSAGASISKIIDQRTGEIIKGDIILTTLNQYFSDQYFVRCSPLDARAQHYPFPDDLIGELITFITAHETGHVFGLHDGHYGQYTYPFEKMRDKTWLQEMGHTPSVMNYTRHNFIVQPEDSIPPQLLLQKVGPTDLYSIRWGYTPFEAASTPDDELPYLDTIVKEQDTIPWYRYLSVDSKFIGPQGTSEVVESDDPIKATELGIQNLKRVIQLIPLATRNERGNEIKKRLYNKTLGLWSDQMELVVSLVGGYTIQHKSTDQEGPQHVPVPANRQKEAVAFLNKEAFQTSLWMAPKDLIRRFEQDIPGRSFLSSSIQLITPRQITVLKSLFKLNRLSHLQELDLTTQNTYPMAALFQDLNAGLFEELKAKDIKIDPYRQVIQIEYIISLKRGIDLKRKKILGTQKYKNSNYIRGIMYYTLHALKNTIENTLKKVKDPVMQAHLKLCLLEINKTQK